MLRRIVETLPEFIERHGGKSASILVDGWRLFEDGAKVQIGDRANSWAEPPGNPTALAKARQRYYEAKLREEQVAFEKFREHCREQLKLAKAGVGPPPINPTEQLNRGKKRIQKLRAELEKIDAELKYSPGEQAHQRRRELDFVTQRRLNAQLAEINEITLD